MKILVLNCGSSSIKYKLFEMESKQVMAQGGIEKIGLPDSFLLVKLPNGEKVKFEKPMPEHTVGIELILEGQPQSAAAFVVPAHTYAKKGEPIMIEGRIYNHGTKGIDAIEKILPGVPQVAVFDTAFHQTMPDYAYMYALPYELYEKYAIRRYGFHGTSHRYVSARVCEFLGVDPKGKKIVTAHIGGGGSCTAVMDGKSVDTSMGLTPVEGLMMGTRAGDLDLGAATFIMDKEHLSTAEFNNLVNKKSGLLGVSGVSSDCRDIEAAINAGNKRADLARKMFIYRVIKYIGAYAAAMNGLDILVFTAGIGENDPYIRAQVMKGLSFLGIEVDEEANKVRGEERIISKKGSKVTVCLIPTDEELMIASDTAALI